MTQESYEIGQAVIYHGNDNELRGKALTVTQVPEGSQIVGVTDGAMRTTVYASTLTPLAPPLTAETVKVGSWYAYVGPMSIRGRIVQLDAVRDAKTAVVRLHDGMSLSPWRLALADLVPVFQQGDKAVYIGTDRPDLFGKELSVWMVNNTRQPLNEAIELPGLTFPAAWYAPRADLRWPAPKPMGHVFRDNRIENSQHVTLSDVTLKTVADEPERVTVRVGADGVEYGRTYLMGGTVVERKVGHVTVRLDTPDGREVKVLSQRVMAMPEGWVDPIDRLLAELKTELIGALLGHAPLHNAHEGYAVLLEEVRELEAEVFKNPKKHVRRIREEGIQVSAMGIRLLLDTLDAPWAKPDPEPTKPA